MDRSRDIADARLPQLREQEPLARYTGWRIGGPARYMAIAASEGELVAALRWAIERELPVLMLGGGTNMLISDQGFPGLVVRYRAQMQQLEDLDGEARLYVAAGAPMAGTARRMSSQGYRGLQWAEGLPGTIGGAVYGNAGCYGGDVASQLTRAWMLQPDGSIEVWDVERLGYGYRTSVLKAQAAEASGPPGPVVLAAEFRLVPDNPQVLRAEMEAIALARRSKTPGGSSCGSVFKNPPGDAAGRLIEAAGLKGLRVGGAIISEKHGNYIINQGGASAKDVLALIDLAREEVLRQFGVALDLEVQLVGFGGAEGSLWPRSCA
ncbi:MAG: UDP-N-acetylenolpyruvoylglucosamine reductase [Herpetosiphonaceae bacterium]|nr:MAG: UDP-N-acetylenolpyruvoylglucosamine reductase [Herpetosiphonaceae bacterium]